MPTPLRISIVSFNIWITERWAMRAPALEKFLQLFQPDILGLQEVQPESLAAIDQWLPRHARVRDAFPGWNTEGNIYWRSDLFTETEHGAEDVGIPENRRLFWARLCVRETGQSVLVGTAHLTHQRDDPEAATGSSPRIGQMRQIIAALQRLNQADEALFFMGDLNDPAHPQHMLHEAGYQNCFGALGLQPAATWKAYPTAGVEPGEPPVSECIDWLVANDRARAVAASVPHFYYRDASPSDHWPVHAVYELA